MDTQPNEQTSSVTIDTTTRLGLLKSRLEIAKLFCKKPHAAMKKWMAEYNISDWSDTDELREKVRIGYLFRKTESELPAIFDDQPDLFIKGKNANARQIEPLITGLYDFLWQSQDLDTVIEDAGVYFEVIGMGFVKSPYVTKTKTVQVTPTPSNTQEEQLEETSENPQEESTETGSQEGLEEQSEPQDPQDLSTQKQTLEVPVVDNPKASVVNPLKLYFSPETKFSIKTDYEHCPYFLEEMVMTTDEIKARFGKDVDASETLKITSDDADVKTDPDNGAIVKDDLKRVTVYEYYGCLPEDKVKGLDSESAWSYDKDYHVYFTSSTELLAEESPYTDQKPLFIMGNYGFADKFFKFGDAKHLMPLIAELEFYRTQVLRHTRKMANPKALIDTNTEMDEERFRDPREGQIIKYNGNPPTYLQPATLGKEVMDGIEMVRTDLEKTAGSFDLENGGGESQVRSPAGIKTFSAAADKNTERKRKKVARFIKELIIFQFKQVATFWKPEDGKTIAVLDTDQPQQSMQTQDPQMQQGNTSVQVNAEVLQVIGAVGQLYNLDIETESMSINKTQQKQDALDLFTLAVQHPDIFQIPQFAKNLLENGYGYKDADRYLLSDQQRQQIASGQKPQLGENVSIRVDAATPVGAELLEQAGLIPQGSAQSLAAASQIQSQAMPPELTQNPAQNVMQ